MQIAFQYPESDPYWGWLGLACETNHIFKDPVVWITADNDNFVARLVRRVSFQSRKQNNNEMGMLS